MSPRSTFQSSGNSDAHRAGDREHRHGHDHERHDGRDDVERALHQMSLMASAITGFPCTSYFSFAIRLVMPA
jgi:hypothetical protein